MKSVLTRWILPLLLFAALLPAQAQNRFPKPDFESGYQYPAETHLMPPGLAGDLIDIAILIAMLSVAAWAVLKRRSRKWVIGISLVSVAWFGFIKEGCVCPVGSIQNVALAMADPTYILPISVWAYFFIPLFFALLFGRIFCSGVCPFGALQDLVHVKNFPISKALSGLLGLLPWIYLGISILFAITHTSFLICKFDPFVGFFRLGGPTNIMIFGGLLLLASIFTGRPYCRFLCPYGALLKIFSKLSFTHAVITPKPCVYCALCMSACPSDAILYPQSNQAPETRREGVKRILLYFVLLPLLVVVGAWIFSRMAPSFALSNKTVVLSEILLRANPDEMENSLDVQAFRSQEGVEEALHARAAEIRNTFHVGMLLVGGFIGMLFGSLLISLSLKRKRESYLIDKGNCVSCARCFSYCPLNLNSNDPKEDRK